MLQSHPLKKKICCPTLQKGNAVASTLQDSELVLQLPECKLLSAHSGGLLLPLDK